MNARQILLLTFLLLIHPSASVSEMIVASAEFDKKIKGQHYKENSKVTVFDCHDQCEDDTSCQSINFFKSMSLCQLFNYTRYYEPMKTLQSHSGAIIIKNMRHPCGKYNIYRCKNKGQCFEEVQDPKQWRCVCLPWWKEKDCSGKEVPLPKYRIRTAFMMLI